MRSDLLNRLIDFCEEHDLDSMLVDLELTYQENMDYLTKFTKQHEFYMTRQEVKTQFTRLKRITREWKDRQILSEYERAGEPPIRYRLYLKVNYRLRSLALQQLEQHGQIEFYQKVYIVLNCVELPSLETLITYRIKVIAIKWVYVKGWKYVKRLGWFKLRVPEPEQPPKPEPFKPLTWEEEERLMTPELFF